MITVREIVKQDLSKILPLVTIWNSKLDPVLLESRLATMVELGYRCIGAYDDQQLVGIAGYWTGCQFWCGKFIQPDNVIVDEPRRGQGIGQLMLEWIHEEGRRLGCEVSVLDSYIELEDSHRFYGRLGYEKPGYHFLKRL